MLFDNRAPLYDTGILSISRKLGYAFCHSFSWEALPLFLEGRDFLRLIMLSILQLTWFEASLLHHFGQICLFFAAFIFNLGFDRAVPLVKTASFGPDISIWVHPLEKSPGCPMIFTEFFECIEHPFQTIISNYVAILLGFCFIKGQFSDQFYFFLVLLQGQFQYPPLQFLNYDFFNDIRFPLSLLHSIMPLVQPPSQILIIQIQKYFLCVLVALLYTSSFSCLNF